ncbi:MAG: response regulator transcription factor [Crocinitomicaceae bacterium]|nr:response regulator transcription factor [Crocinitomicaceae bacterium]
MSDTKTILICDDHVLLCDGVADMLRNSNLNYEVFIVHSSEDCTQFLREQKVDVFICDLNIDDKDGFVLIEENQKHLENTRIFIFSAYNQSYLIQKAIKMKLAGFLKKESTSTELIRAIESDTFEFQCNAENFVKNTEFEKIDKIFANKFKLSKQEKEIIKWITKGKTSKEIAEILYISKLTVDTHRKNINRKLEITNSGSLIQYAYENNLHL